MYNNPWIYNNEIFDGPVKGYEGFVYLITNKLTNRKYVGKKHFWTRRKEKGKTRRVTRESPWRDYYGSCEELIQDVGECGYNNFSRVILHLCVYKKEMSYHEESEQWKRSVLLEEEYYNTNIGGKYFVREKHIYSATHREITTKNDNWRQIKSARMMGDDNIAKRPEVRQKISDKKKGENHHQYGKAISKEHLNKLHTAAMARVKRPIIDSDGVEYESGSQYRLIKKIYIAKFYKLLEQGIINYKE